MAAWSWAFWVGGGVLALAGVWLLYRALLADRSRGRRRCPRCWYEMTGVPGLICPECGRAARAETRLLRTRRHWWRAGAALVVITLSVAAAVAPQILRTGVARSLPTSLLIGAMWAFDGGDWKLLGYVEERLNAMGGAASAGPKLSGIERWMLRSHAVGLVLKPRSGSTSGPPPIIKAVNGNGPIGWLFQPATPPRLGADYGIDHAVLLLEAVGSDAKLATPAFVIVLRSDQPRNRKFAAAEGLARLNAFDDQAVAALAKILRDDVSLWDYGILAVATTPGVPADVLCSLLDLPDASQRSRLLRFLMAKSSEPICVDLVCRLLRSDPDSDVRLTASLALALRRDDARVSVPDLEAAFRTDPAAEVRRAAIVALFALPATSERRVGYAVEALRSESPDIRAFGVKSLGQMPYLAAAHASEVELAAADEDPAVRELAKALLARLPKKPDEAAPTAPH